MHKVDVDSLLQGKQSKYALVVGVAKKEQEKLLRLLKRNRL